MYPGWPDKGRDKQGGQVEQKSERALGVSSHDEEHCGEQPVVAWINILLSGWEERLKTSKDWLGVIKDYGSYQLLQNFMYARNQEKTNKNKLGFRDSLNYQFKMVQKTLLSLHVNSICNSCCGTKWCHSSGTTFKLVNFLLKILHTFQDHVYMGGPEHPKGG